MKILLTGSTGFLGKAIKEIIPVDDLITLGRHDCNIIADISVDFPVLPPVNYVIHAAGKAHLVPKTEKDKYDFHLINVIGTQNLLKALEHNLPESFLFISSVAVYGKSTGILINEEEELTAIDSYGKSKIEAERLVKKWCSKNGVRVSILRLPLVVGPNPPGNLGAMIKGIQKGYYFNIAGGIARKSMVSRIDVAKIIPKALEVGGVYNLTDGYHPSFAEISNHISIQLSKGKLMNMPLWLAKIIAKFGDLLGNKAPLNTIKLKKITSHLTFDDTKAREGFGWNPTRVLEGFKIN
jgi:nucleoside-diphosphate-sugar epimerase